MMTTRFLKIMAILAVIGLVSACGGGGGGGSGGGSDAAISSTSIKASPGSLRRVDPGDTQVFSVQILVQSIDNTSGEVVSEGRSETTLELAYFSSSQSINDVSLITERLALGDGTVGTTAIYQDSEGALIDFNDENGNEYVYEGTDLTEAAGELNGVLRFPSPIQPGTSTSFGFLLVDFPQERITDFGDRTVTVSNKELVDTDLGRIETFPVTISESRQRNSILANPIHETTTYWIHPDIGIVKFSSITEEEGPLLNEKTSLDGGLKSVSFSLPAATPADVK